MKNLVIKTPAAIVYVVNGKVSCVRCKKSGRFMTIKKFSNIVNNVFLAAKNASEAIKNNKGFYFDNVTKLALRAFNNVAKIAVAILGGVHVFTSKNYCTDGFNFNYLNQYC